MKSTKAENILNIVEIVNSLSEDEVRDIKNISFGLLLSKQNKKEMIKNIN